MNRQYLLGWLANRLVLAVVLLAMVVMPLQCQTVMAASTQPEVVKADPQMVEKAEEETSLVGTEKKAEDTEQGEQETDPEKKQGMSTATKIGIGVGAAALVGLVLAASGGSSDSGPKPPTNEQLLGVWGGRAEQVKDGRTYQGAYNLHTVGQHSYDIILNDGERKTGTGTWYVDEGTYHLHIRNDSGSHYEGDFTPGDLSTIVLTSQSHWQLTLTR